MSILPFKQRVPTTYSSPQVTLNDIWYFSKQFNHPILENWSHHHYVIFHLISQESCFNLPKKSAWVMFLWKTLIKFMWLQEILQRTRPTNDISIEFVIQWNFVMLLLITHSANHKKFCIPVPNLVVIGWAYFKPEHSKISSNFKFDWNPFRGLLHMVRNLISRDFKIPSKLCLGWKTFYAVIHVCPCP